MTDPAVLRLLAALEAGSAPARFVGGCVRNALLGMPVMDVDLATPARPEDVQRLLAAAGLRSLPTGLRHGTVTALVDGNSYEITTLRRDVETDGRHAVVAFTDDWAEDAKRRDFTMNAIFCAPDGTLFDPVDGLPDVQIRRVRFVGEARQRIREDFLRLLRFFRFHAYYGKPPPDEEALAACRELAPMLPTLSGERVRDEVSKLLRCPDPAGIWRLMLDLGVIAHLLPAATDTGRLARLAGLETSFGLADWLRRLAALLPAAPDMALSAAERLKLSNDQRDRLVSMLSAAASTSRMGEDIRRNFYRLGPSLTLDLALLEASAVPESAGNIEAVLDLTRQWTRPRLPIDGADVLNQGVSPGRRVGELLRTVEEWWIDRDFAPSREACLEQLMLLADGAR